MLTAHGSIETAIEAMRKVPTTTSTKPFRRCPSWKSMSRRRSRRSSWPAGNGSGSNSSVTNRPRYRLVGRSPAMQRVVAMIEKVAPTDATVLVRGASGTGKELVARACTTTARAAIDPLVTINCAALQESCWRANCSATRKARSPARSRPSRAWSKSPRAARCSSTRLPKWRRACKPKLLRVLENGHYRRVGGTQESHADVRVVAATNRARWSRRSRPAGSARICSIGSTS